MGHVTVVADKSRLGSVQYMDGEMLTQDWTSVYIPLDDTDAQAFLRKVERREMEVGHRLNKAELVLIANTMG